MWQLNLSIIFSCHPLSVSFFIWIKSCGKFHMSTQVHKKCGILSWIQWLHRGFLKTTAMWCNLIPPIFYFLTNLDRFSVWFLNPGGHRWKPHNIMTMMLETISGHLLKWITHPVFHTSSYIVPVGLCGCRKIVLFPPKSPEMSIGILSYPPLLHSFNLTLYLPPFTRDDRYYWDSKSWQCWW